MKLIAIETSSGLLFKGGHALEVERITRFTCDEKGDCLVPATALFAVLPKLTRAGHAVGVINPFKFIPKQQY